MATLPGLRVPVTLDSSTFIAESRRIDASVNRMGRNVATQSAVMQRSFAGAAAAVRTFAVGMAAAVGAASVGSLARTAKAALDMAGNLGELSQRAGVTTRQLQILTVASTQVGIGQEQLVTALGQFGRRTAEAAQGTGTLVKTLNQYGIATKTASGGTRQSVDVLGDLADAVKNATSDQEKLRIAGEAFGSRVGTRLVPLLNEGAEGFQRWAEQAEAAGLIISDKLIAQADQASDAIATLQLAMSTGFQTGVIESFGASVSSSTEALRQARDAGAAFGEVAGLAFRAAAAAAIFVARNWREIVTVGSALIGLKLGAVIGGIAVSMIQLAGAIRVGATAMAIFNSVVGKNLFVLLAKGIIAAGTALATWLALTKAAESSTAELADELAAMNALFDDAETGLAGVSEEAQKAAEALESMLAASKRENEQLTALKAAHKGYGSSVERVTNAIEIDNQLRAAKITRLQAEKSGLLAVMVANQKLREEVEALTAAEERRLEVFKAMNDEEMGRRMGQASAGGLSAPGMTTEDLDEVSRAYENFLDSLQSSTASVFENIYSGGVTSFKDLFDEAKRLAIQFAAQLSALAIFEPGEFAKFFGGTGAGAGGAGAGGGGWFATAPTWGQGAGAAGAGAAGGLAFGGIAGGAAGGGLMGGLAGAGAGAASGALAGSMILPGWGTVIGAGVGAVAGGLMGAFSGGGDDKSKGTVSGGLGQISGSGKNLGALTSALQQFDQQISSLLNARQREAVDASLRNFSRFISVKGGISQSDIANATSQRAQAAGRGLGFSNTQTAQDIGTALGTQRAIEDLTGAVTAFERQTEDLDSQFETLTANARRFGISTVGMADALDKATADLQKAQDAAISSLLDPFRALLAPLEALQTRLDFTGLNPAEQFARAQADFQRIAAEASAGSIPAIQQFEAAADLFTQLAGQVGASPGAATAISTVQAALADIRGDIVEAQADASRGVEDIMDRADRNNTVRLDQVVELIQEQIRLMKNGGKKI